MTVVFYISGHGFGHASRQVEIVHALARLHPSLRIIIRSAVNPGLLERTLAVPCELRPGPCDTGIVQATSIQHDDPATIREAAKFYTTYDARIETEAGALAHDAISLVVGDIAPMAFEVAARLRVPGVAIGNFTWDWIYETHPGFVQALPDLIPRLRASYRKATLALELPFAGGFEVFPHVTRVPLVARRATRSRADTRAHFGLPPSGRIALLSFGGYGLPNLDLNALDCLDEWTVVTTDRLKFDPGSRTRFDPGFDPGSRTPLAPRSGESPTPGESSTPGVELASRPGASSTPGVELVSESAFQGAAFRYEDLVAAVDVVITKPGYGITAECISTGTAMLYTSRGDFREYDLLVGELPRYVRCRFISQADLLAGRWASALDALLGQPAPPESMATDGADEVARVLSALLDASR